MGAEMVTQAGSETSLHTENVDDLLKFALGFAEGVLSDEGVLGSCVADAVGAGKSALEVVNDIKEVLQPPHNGFADLASALKQLVNNIKQVMPDCGATHDDIQNLLAALKQIQSLKDLIPRLEKTSWLISMMSCKN